MRSKRVELLSLAKPFYSINEAAEILDVHPNTIRNKIKDGTIKAGRIGRQWRISRDVIFAIADGAN